jgi:hypothetical protein
LTALNLPNLHAISMSDFEAGDCELLRAKQNRSTVEYYFTCTPSLPLYVFKHCPNATIVSYVDADMFFFGSPQPVFDEMGANSIAIVAHRFPKALRWREQWGKYNVGILSFRRDAEGIACLQWWRERCIEWCYDRMEETRFADQKYLDVWPERFASLSVLEHKGVNVAPWNLMNHPITEGSKGPLVGDQPLVLFHFHGLSYRGGKVYDPGVEAYDGTISRTTRDRIYVPYIRALIEASDKIQAIKTGAAPVENIRPTSVAAHQAATAPRSIKETTKFMSENWKKIVKGQYILMLNGRSI